MALQKLCKYLHMHIYSTILYKSTFINIFLMFLFKKINALRSNVLPDPTHDFMKKCKKMLNVNNYIENNNSLQKVVWNKEHEYNIGISVVENTLKKKADEIITNILIEIKSYFPDDDLC